MLKHRFSVLLIEDDADAMRITRDFVQSQDFEVSCASSGAQGLELAAAHSPDIVVADLRLPDIDGLKVMRAIHEQTPHTPFVLVTGFGDTEIAISALRAGAIDYLRKPVDLDALSLALGRAAEQARQHVTNQPYPVVLVAEDDCKARELLCKAIGEEWTVLEAEDGLQALERFKGNKVDVVLLDIKMPRMNGLQALKEMRQRTDDFEVAFITGYGDETAAVEGMRQGAMGFIRKPVELDELFVTLEKLQEKLTLTRALKFRLREIELAKQVIESMEAKATRQG